MKPLPWFEHVPPYSQGSDVHGGPVELTGVVGTGVVDTGVVG